MIEESSEAAFRRSYSLIMTDVFCLLFAETQVAQDSVILESGLRLIGLAVSIWACRCYSRAKGLTASYAWLGLLQFLGFWYLLYLPGRQPAPESDVALPSPTH